MVFTWQKLEVLDFLRNKTVKIRTRKNNEIHIRYYKSYYENCDRLILPLIYRNFRTAAQILVNNKQQKTEHKDQIAASYRWDDINVYQQRRENGL